MHDHRGAVFPANIELSRLPVMPICSGLTVSLARSAQTSSFTAIVDRDARSFSMSTGRPSIPHRASPHLYGCSILLWGGGLFMAVEAQVRPRAMGIETFDFPQRHRRGPTCALGPAPPFRSRCRFNEIKHAKPGTRTAAERAVGQHWFDPPDIINLRRSGYGAR